MNETGTFAFETTAASWSATQLQAWLLRGLAQFTAEHPSDGARVRRRNAFWPALINPEESLADEVMAAIERVPGKVPEFAQAVSACISLWTPALGYPVLLYLFSLARMARSPDLVATIRHFLLSSDFGSPEGERVLSAGVELVCLLGSAPGAGVLLDLIRHDPRLWRAAHAPSWLRAKVRLGAIGWIEGLSLLRDDFGALIKDGFNITRFLDRLLDDLPGTKEVALSIERFVTNGGVNTLGGLSQWAQFTPNLPWFFNLLFEGQGAPIKPAKVGMQYQLLRRRPFGPEEPPLILVSLGPSDEVVYRVEFWLQVVAFETSTEEAGLASDFERDVLGSLERYN